MPNKKLHNKQNLTPILVEVSKYSAGYQNKLLQDELPAGSATGDSYNFFIDKDGKWTTRPGSQYLGTRSSDTGGCTSSAKILRRDNVEIPVIFYATKSKYLHPDTLDWRILETGYTSGLVFGRAMGEKPTDNVNKLIFGNGTDPYRIWSGITGLVDTFTSSTVTLKNVTSLLSDGWAPIGSISDNGVQYLYQGISKSGIVSSVTTTTVVIQGSQSLSALGFSASGTFDLDGITYTYASLSSQTFVGVTPDPTNANAPTVATVTSNTITITGSTDLSTLGYISAGQIMINNVPFTYTGLSAETFTGVTPDPTPTILGGVIISPTKASTGDFLSQSGGGNQFIGVTPDPTALMVTNDAVAQTPISRSDLPLGNVMTSFNGRIVMFSKPAGALYGGGSILGSVLNTYDSFLFQSPRAPAEGYQLLMTEGGGNGIALIQFEGGVAAFKQNAVSLHSVSLDQNDFPTISPYLPYDETLSGHIGLVGQKLGFALRNQIFFVSPRKVINTLQRVSQVDYPQVLPFSDRIQNTVDLMTWDMDGCGIGFNYLAFFCGKAKSVDTSPNQQLVYDQRFDCWWTPLVGQDLSSYFIFQGDLYATLADSPDVIKLLTGTTDFSTPTVLGNKVNAKLTLERQNFGRKSARKQGRLLFVEGWMSKAGRATFTLALDESGTTFTGDLLGSENGYFFDPAIGGTFGTDEFGVETFGGTWDADNELPDGVGHFRILFNFPKKSFWNCQLSILTSDYFKLINHSPDAMLSPVAIPGSLKKALA